MRRVLAALAGCAAALSAQAAALVLSGGTVVDGYGNPPIANGVVVIDGDRILAVGGPDVIPVPEGAEVISTEGMTVLPGLWDMQVQLMRLGHGRDARWNDTYGPLAERVVMPIAARQLLRNEVEPKAANVVPTVARVVQSANRPPVTRAASGAPSAETFSQANTRRDSSAKGRPRHNTARATP
jgi:imidazolonepropionase-like amidohydrolase